MKILLAEDDDLLREFLKRSLKIDRHLIDAVADGESAVKKAKKQTYDVIILDIVMPYKNGIEACRELRASNITTPILFLTSKDSIASKVIGLDAGADDYIIKPFSYPELTARLRSITRRQTSAVVSKLAYANLTLDLSLRAIYKGDKILDLRPKEYALLEYLLLHNGEAVSRQNILNKVWGIQVISTSNRLDVCVRSLRNKLGKDNITPKIINLHNFGYRLEKSENAVC